LTKNQFENTFSLKNMKKY